LECCDDYLGFLGGQRAEVAFDLVGVGPVRRIAP
jgi:hypothetical protein